MVKSVFQKFKSMKKVTLVLGLLSLGIPSLTYGMEPSAEEDKRHPSISRAFSETSYAGSEEEDTDHCCNRCCSIVCSKKGVIFMGGCLGVLLIGGIGWDLFSHFYYGTPPVWGLLE